MSKKELSEATKKSLDEELFQYNGIMREIAIRKVEIDTTQEYDDNIGGSRGSHISKIPEERTIKYNQDKRINYLEKLKKDIENCYKELTEEQKKIFDLRWLLEEANTWEEIAGKIFCSVKSVYRKREKILEKYARTKGKI